MHNARIPAIALALLLGACAGPSGSVSATGSQQGYRLALLATSCWLGGVWGDIAAQPVADRQEATEKRCRQVVAQVYGGDHPDRLLQLRALEADTVAEVVAKVRAVAAADAVDAAHKDDLVKLLQAVIVAQRENMYARRAADRVRKDYAGDREPGKLTQDEMDAVAPLSACASLGALLDLRAGDVTHDARALGVLSATDRMEIARDLPKHLKVYAVSGVYRLFFGVEAPAVPRDATAPLEPGLWLRYLTQVAAAAGHPVPGSAATNRARDALAWGGVLMGLADKLRPELDQLSPEGAAHLRRVVATVIRRFDNEYGILQKEATAADERRAQGG